MQQPKSFAGVLYLVRKQEEMWEHPSCLRRTSPASGKHSWALIPPLLKLRPTSAFKVKKNKKLFENICARCVGRPPCRQEVTRQVTEVSYQTPRLAQHQCPGGGSDRPGHGATLTDGHVCKYPSSWRQGTCLGMQLQESYELNSALSFMPAYGTLAMSEFSKNASSAQGLPMGEDCRTARARKPDKTIKHTLYKLSITIFCH